MKKVIINIVAIVFVFLLVLVANASEPTVSVYDDKDNPKLVVIEVCDGDMCRSLVVDKKDMKSKFVETWTLETVEMLTK